MSPRSAFAPRAGRDRPEAARPGGASGTAPEAPAFTTQDVYFGRKVASTDARDILEVFDDSLAPEDISGGFLGVDLGHNPLDGV